MRLPIQAILALFFLTLPLVLASCSQKDDDPWKEQDKEVAVTDDFLDYVPRKTEYCVLFYGAGGGNLDAFILDHISEIVQQRSSERVQMAMQFKFSYYLQHVTFNPELSNTCRLIANEAGKEKGYLKQKFAEDTYDMGTAQALTSFLKWAQKVCPADHYILSLWGHGNGWNPAFDTFGGTKAIVFDDNNGTYLQLGDVIKGIRDSGLPMDAVILDSCAMGMAEVYAALSDVTSYAISTPSVSSGSTGNFQVLMQYLEASAPYADGGLRKALEDYVDKVMSDMQYQGEKVDLSVTDLRDMDRLLDIIKDLTDALVDNYEVYREDIDKATAATLRLIKDDGFFPLDLGDFVDNLSSLMPRSPFTAIKERLDGFKKDSFHSARTAALETLGINLFLSITLMDHATFCHYHYDEAYPLLKLEEKTHWSRFLGINLQTTDSNVFLYDES